MAEIESGIPVPETRVKRDRVRFVVIGVGQGGFNIANTLKTMLPGSPFTIAINTSDADLDMIKNLPVNQKFKIGTVNADGAGKNRSKAKAYFKNFSQDYQGSKLNAMQVFMHLYEEVLFHQTTQTIIFVCFSADGGTGSGLGVQFTTYLTNEINTRKSFRIGATEYEIDDVTNEVPRPVVVGIVPKCKSTGGHVGIQNIQNTIECFSDIQTAINNGIGNYFIADNNLPSDVHPDTDEAMYRIINARIVAPFIKFFGISTNSTIKCLDLQDKIHVLRTPGCSSWTTLTKTNQFQYIIPQNQAVKRVVELIKQSEDGADEKLSRQIIAYHDVTGMDNIRSYFDVSSMDVEVDSVSKSLIESSMIGYFGFMSLGPVIEDLRAAKHRIQDVVDKKNDIIASETTGFHSMKEDATAIDEAFMPKTVSTSTIDSMFD